MKTGEYAKTESGIVPAHCDKISAYAKKWEQTILIRPVNPLSTSLIKAGFGTKDMHVKGKSSDWGPQAGFICTDQAFSKLAGKNAGAVGKFNSKVESCLREKNATSVPLLISDSRLNELESKKKIYIKERSDNKIKLLGRAGSKSQSAFFTLFRWNSLSSAQRIFFRKHKSAVNNMMTKIAGLDNPWLVMKGDLAEEMGEILMVLAHPATGVPLTADYDLYAVCPKREESTIGQMMARHGDTMPGILVAKNSGSKNRAILDEKSRREHAAKLIQRRFRKGQAERRIGDVGRAPNYLMKAVRGINQACGRADNPVCHHGGEVDNPNPENDWNIMVFNSHRSGESFLRTDNKRELEQIVSEIIEQEMVFYTNRAYGSNFKRSRLTASTRRYLTPHRG